MLTLGRFFVVANSVVSAYLILSLPLSIAHIIRSGAKYSRLVLIIFDAVRLYLALIQSVPVLNRSINIMPSCMKLCMITNLVY